MRSISSSEISYNGRTLSVCAPLHILFIPSAVRRTDGGTDQWWYMPSA